MSQPSRWALIRPMTLVFSWSACACSSCSTSAQPTPAGRKRRLPLPLLDAQHLLLTPCGMSHPVHIPSSLLPFLVLHSSCTILSLSSVCVPSSFCFLCDRHHRLHERLPTLPASGPLSLRSAKSPPSSSPDSGVSFSGLPNSPPDLPWVDRGMGLVAPKALRSVDDTMPNQLKKKA